MLKSPVSLIDAVDIYLNDCLGREQSLRTVEGKTSALLCFLRWCETHKLIQLNDVQDDHLESYRHWMRAYRIPYSGKLLDVATRRNKLTAVKVFLVRMFERSYLSEDPTLRFKLPRLPRRLPKGFLVDVEIDAIFKQTAMHGDIGLRDRAILETYYATGIRRAELGRLKLNDIDFENFVVRIEQGKGKKDRVIPIAKRACQWVTQYFNNVRPSFAIFASGSVLFLNNDGLPFTDRQLTALVSKYVRRAGVDKPGACNLYRHTTATAMLENGADIRYIQEQLGHADISTTQVYTHVTIGKLKEVYHHTHPAAREGE
ncbi:tyrosine-type recombinase/integrase [Shewanella putrefaciens]|uniref:tyrosine-type recombinase/integrase n=1 Tax=Shewanella putrefaciens TaxID=24 RepID=UPI0021C0825F|nr:tyrosine-type recombinase/integrase [Shewanella putrefaciens]UXK08005.1 tyrosine-type recombinase/integrase [Shewanella putrefaciens]